MGAAWLTLSCPASGDVLTSTKSVLTYPGFAVPRREELWVRSCCLIAVTYGLKQRLASLWEIRETSRSDTVC